MKDNRHPFTAGIFRWGFLRKLPLLASLLAVPALHAQDYTWKTAPVSGLWNTGSNWIGNSAANGTTSTAIFGASSQTSISVNTTVTLGGLRFNSGAPVYTFTIGSSQLLSLYDGVVNNSASAQNLVVNNGGNIYLYNSSSLDDSNLTVNSGGRATFYGTSTAGDARITNRQTNSFVDFYESSSAGNAYIDSRGQGFTYFWDNSTAGNATILTGVYTLFQQSASAGNATLTVEGGSELAFYDTTTAANATITLGGPSLGGGTLKFSGTASGGNATISNYYGQVDISGMVGSTFSTGSIESNEFGIFYLGNKTFTVGGNNKSTTVSGQIMDGGVDTGTGASLVKTGTGTLTLTGTNGYTGSTVAQQGTILVGGAQALAGSTVNYNNQGGVIAFGNISAASFGGLTGSQGLTLENDNGDALALTVGVNNATTTYDGILDGDGILIKAGSGTLTLTNANTQAGGTRVTAGVFRVTGAGTFGSGPLDVVGGAFDLNGTTFSAGNLIVNGGTVRSGTLPIGTFEGRSGTISASITGNEFVKSGTGTLSLTGTNFYTGPTTINGGALRVSGSALPASSYFKFNGGVLGVGASNPTAYTSGTGAGQISWEGDGGFAAYSGTRTITFNGSGTQTWGQGGFVPNGNALILSAGDSDNLTIFANSIDFDGGTRTVRVENGTPALDATLSGDLTNGALVKSGPGTISLTGINTYSGGTRITGGLIQFTALSNLGSGSVLLDGGGLRWATGVTTDVSSSLSYGNGGSIFDTNGNNVTLATAVGTGTAGGTTSGGLIKLGTGTLTLNGNNMYTGTTTVSQGALVLSGSNSGGNIVGAAGTIISAIGNQAALGNGTVTMNTGTSLRLAYDTNPTFNAGLVISGSNPFLLFNRVTNGNGLTYTFKDAYFEGTTDEIFNRQEVGFLNGAAVTGGNTAIVFANVSSGLNTNLTLRGGMQLTFATLAIGADHKFEIGDNGSGVAPSFTVTGGISGTNSELGLYVRGNVQLAGPISGSNVLLYLSGTGTKTLLGNSTFSGTTDLNWGTTVVGSDTALGTSIVLLEGGALRSDGTARTLANPMRLTWTSTISGSSNLTFSNTLTNTSGANETLVISNTGTTTFNAVDLANSSVNRTVTFNTGAGANAVINGPIANGSTSTASGLTKSGAGNLTLTGSNAYSGTTTLTAGNLIIGHNNALGASTLTFNGGTLTGNGTARSLANAMILNANSSIAGASDLTFTGNLSLGTNTRTLTVTNTGSTTFSGTLSNTAGFTKAGAGELTLSGTASTFTGKTTISAGSLTVMALSNTSVISSLGAPTTAGNATIDIGATTSSGTLKYIGAGSTSNRVINLAGTTGGATIDSSGAGPLVLNAGAFTATGAGGKTLTLAGTNTGANSISSTIVNSSAATSLEKTGAGAWSVTGANTFTGSTTIREGLLSANKIAVSGGNSSLGNTTTAVVLGNTTTSGTLAYTGGSVTYTRGLTVNAGGGGFATTTAGQTTTIGTAGIVTAGRFTVSGSGNTTISSAISGTGSVTKTGSGQLALSSSNSYTGGTTVNSGTLLVSQINALGTASVVVNGGVFAVDVSGTISNAVQMSGGSFSRSIGSGTSYANAVNATSDLAGGVDTTAKLLAGTASGTTSLITSFSATSSATNDGLRLSDVYAFQGTGSDIFVMELSFTATDAGTYLGWLSGNQWINARDGNAGNNPAFASQFSGSYLEFLAANPGVSLADSLGAWGSTVTGGKTYVWAVLNHNSEFSVVPEPASAALFAGGVALLFFARRQNRSRGSVR